MRIAWYQNVREMGLPKCHKRQNWKSSGSVGLSLFMDGNDGCKLPSMPFSTGGRIPEEFNIYIIKCSTFYENIIKNIYSHSNVTYMYRFGLQNVFNMGIPVVQIYASADWSSQWKVGGVCLKTCVWIFNLGTKFEPSYCNNLLRWAFWERLSVFLYHLLFPFWISVNGEKWGS